MSLGFRFIIFDILMIIIFSAPLCKENENYCSKCNLLTNLCDICLKDIFIPDEKGGCIPSKKCAISQNYCIECNKEENLCKTCDEGYFPDENGGCSYAMNCELSYKGECLKCKNDFELIGQKGLLFICKSRNSDDLKNCKEVNNTTGYCKKCEDNFYLNEVDKKCIKTSNCSESIYGVCTSCAYGFYLDKKEDKCLVKDEKFYHCKETVDGKTCDKCDNNFFLAEDGNCVDTNFCSKGNDTHCKECISGYYLTEKLSCSKEKNCASSDIANGICLSCSNDFYLDIKTRQCKSNTEDNDLKYCKISNETCIECDPKYNLGEDNKCSTTKYCKESEFGLCQSCSKDYYLGLDYRCTKIENCIYSYNYFECRECKDNYYYNKHLRVCEAWKEKFEGCKASNMYGDICFECKNDYYINRTDNLCYSNKEEGPFYKCAQTDNLGEHCDSCIEEFFWDSGDYKCTKVEGCFRAENENKCLECDEYFCFVPKNNTCKVNFYLEEEKDKIYFRCNITNEEVTACQICEDDKLILSEEGLCIDKVNCIKEEGGKCLQCIEKNNKGYLNCLNNIFGCVETFAENCLRCDDILNFDKCTECKEGYKLNEYNICSKIKP